jgi:Family of unknown function (DUF5682)
MPLTRRAAALGFNCPGRPPHRREPRPQARHRQGGEGAGRRRAVSSLGDFHDRAHAAGFPKEREPVRTAFGQARLRSAARPPGRRELVEALQACLTQGEPLDRGRAVARAMQRVLVGERGRLGAGTCRSDSVRTSKRCSRSSVRPVRPTRGRRSSAWTPPRSRLERRQVVVIHRLTVCAVPDAEPLGPGGDGARLTSTWRLAWPRPRARCWSWPASRASCWSRRRTARCAVVRPVRMRMESRIALIGGLTVPPASGAAAETGCWRCGARLCGDRRPPPPS